MKIEKISSQFKDWALLEELFQEAFPEDQLTDLQGTIQLSQEGNCDFSSFTMSRLLLALQIFTITKIIRSLTILPLLQSREAKAGVVKLSLCSGRSFQDKICW